MKITLGILAHVDAGKTTFSEALLYHAHSLRAMGRVDHQDAFLDAHPLEKERGITIFSDQAIFHHGEDEYFLVDTPGHVDFAAEMERALAVLDYAVLVVSCAEGVQSHTETIWNLLRRRNIPTFVFLNKVDRVGADADRVLEQMRRRLSADCVAAEHLDESVAERNEALLDRYLAGELTQQEVEKAASEQYEQRRTQRVKIFFHPLAGGLVQIAAGLLCVLFQNPLAGSTVNHRFKHVFKKPMRRYGVQFSAEQFRFERGGGNDISFVHKNPPNNKFHKSAARGCGR